MQDDSVITPGPVDPADVASASAVSVAAPQKSPLDILEDILAESQQDGGADATTAGVGRDVLDAGDFSMEGSGVDAVAVPDEAVLRQQVDTDMAAQAVVDQQDILVKIEELKTITDTPEYKAGLAQEVATESARQTHKHSLEGSEILQLKHIKIPVEVANVST